MIGFSKISPKPAFFLGANDGEFPLEVIELLDCMDGLLFLPLINQQTMY